MPVLSLSSSPLTKFPADAHNGKNAGASPGCEEEGEEAAALTSCQTIRQEGGKEGRACC